MQSQQLSMSGACLDPDLTFGCIRVSDADRLPLAMVNVVLSESEVSITFMGDNPQPWDKDSMVAIRMFRLPGGAAEFKRVTEWFGKDRKTRARLPEGMPFDADTLAIREAPEGWEHEAFPRSSRDFVHIYRGQDQAVLMRLTGKSGMILDNPLLRQVLEGLRIVPGQWVQEVPATHSCKSAGDAVRDRSLPDDAAVEIREAAGRARNLLALPTDLDSTGIVKAIYDQIEVLRGGKDLSLAEMKQWSVDLGVLWAEALCAAGGWEWRSISTDGGVEAYGVCSPDRSHVVHPTSLIHRLLALNSAPNNTLLLFNMILSGEVPRSASAAYTWLE